MTDIHDLKPILNPDWLLCLCSFGFWIILVMGLIARYLFRKFYPALKIKINNFLHKKSNSQIAKETIAQLNKLLKNSHKLKVEHASSEASLILRSFYDQVQAKRFVFQTKSEIEKNNLQDLNTLLNEYQSLSFAQLNSNWEELALTINKTIKLVRRWQ